MHTITQKEAFEKIMDEHEKIFSCQFIKKDGTIRNMIARRGVTKGVTGAGLKYDPAAHNLIIVFDMRKAAFRSIPVDRLIKFKLAGERYQVTP
jgi:hypothetical protein